MEAIRLWHRQIVHNMNSAGNDGGHFRGFMVGPVLVCDTSNAEVFENFSGVCGVTDILVCGSRICASVFEQELLTTRMVFLVVCYIVDVIPQGDPKVSLAGMLRYLLKSVYTVGHGVV